MDILNIETLANNFINIDVGFLILFIKIIIMSYLIIIFKRFIDHLVAYTLFKKHSYVSMRREVNVDGFDGIITSISLGEIVISNDTSIYVIPTTRWRYSRWVFYINETMKSSNLIGAEFKKG